MAEDLGSSHQPRDTTEAELPYRITSHIDVRLQEDGSLAVFFGRSLHWAMVSLLCIAGVAGALASWLLWLMRLDATLIWLPSSLTLFGIGIALCALWRRTGVIAKRDGLLLHTVWLPGLELERSIPREKIESLRRHLSLRLAGRAVYQIRAELTDGARVVVGHGITDKVEAASIASALERALG